MPTKSEKLETELDELRDFANKTAGRNFTADEHAWVNDRLDRVKSLKAEIALNEQVDFFGDTIGYNEATGTSQTLNLPGGQKHVPTGSWGRSMQTHLESRGQKAFLDPSGTITASPTWLAPVADEGSPGSFIADVIPQIKTAGMVSYLRQTVRTNLAGVVPKGDTKPTSVFTVERIDRPTETIAHLSEAINRADLMDSRALSDFLESELRLGLKLALDDQIVNGDPTSGGLDGLANLSGSQPISFSTDVLTTTRKAVTALQEAYSTPSHFLFAPADWEGLDLTTDDEDRYYFGGPQVVGTPKLWGIAVITSTAVSEGTAYLGDFTRQSRLFTTESANVTWSETVGDAFEKNQVVFRCEERTQVGWLRPAGFAEIALTAGP